MSILTIDTAILDKVYDEAAADCFRPFSVDHIVEIIVIASVGRDFNIAAIVDAIYRYNDEYKYHLADDEVRRIGSCITRMHTVRRIYRRLGRMLNYVKRINNISYSTIDDGVMVIDYD